jgi:peptide/nickel transport system ATP-binding protein
MVQRFRASLVIVTHNMGVVARYAQRIYIMYAGRIVESGTTKEIFSRPRHPYTIGLLKCIPRLDEEEGAKLIPIVGMPPNLINMPPTCAFLPRCSYKIDKCFKEPWPELTSVSDNHFIRCYANTEEKK